MLKNQRSQDIFILKLVKLLCVPGSAVRVHKQPRDNWKIMTKIIVFFS
nr:MAG TPA: hypothetical protein [Caudoviricetes sp.]